MKTNKCLLLLIWVLTAGTGGLGHADTVQKIRPITIKVVDAQTKEPLQGIVANYFVVRGTFRTSFLWVFPPIEPLVETSIEARKTAYTDANGEVSFEGVEVRLREYRLLSRVDRIDSEYVFVNLEPSEGAKRFYSDMNETIDGYGILYRSLPNLERIASPNRKYKGYWLGSLEIAKAHGREQEKATVSFRPDDFRGETRVYFVAPLLRTQDAGGSIDR